MNLHRTLTGFYTTALDKNQEAIMENERRYKQVEVKKNDILIEVKTLKISNLNLKITLFFHINSNFFIRDENDEWNLIKI